MLDLSGSVTVLDAFCQVALEKVVHSPGSGGQGLLHRARESTRQDRNFKIPTDATETVSDIHTGVLYAGLLSECSTLTF